MSALMFEEKLNELNIEFKKNVNLSEHTSFKIGGNAEIFVMPASKAELVSAVNLAREQGIGYFILGKGSNILVSDLGIEGAVIDTSKLNKIERNENIITCECGVSLIRLCNFAAENSLKGLEFAFGIPGSVGGAMIMNAGAYGGEISAAAKSAECLDIGGNIVNLKLSASDFSYRSSIFKKKDLIVLSASFSLESGDCESIRSSMNEFMKRRKEKQPLEYPSAGSTFKRPAGYFAGALIEKNGFKGFSVGGAQVSEKHAGFIINKNRACEKDVSALIKIIQEKVLKNDGVLLEPEVIKVGRKE